MVAPKRGLHLREDLGEDVSVSNGALFARGQDTRGKGHLHAMVVLIRPTFVSKAILANSMANSGVSTILSFKTLEHLLELKSAFT